MSHKVRGGGRRCARWLTSLALGWTGFAAWQQSAQAGPMVNRGVAATAVIHQTVNLAIGCHTFETKNPTPSGSAVDSVMHIWGTPAGVSALPVSTHGGPKQDLDRDDDSGAYSMSKVQNFCITVAKTVDIIVYSYTVTSGGRVDLYVNGVESLHQAKIGSTLVYAPTGADYTGGAPSDLIAATAFQPGGTIDSMLYAFAWDGRLTGFDDNSGVGYQSQLKASEMYFAPPGPPLSWDLALNWVRVASKTEAVEGPVSVIFNDYTIDDDGDKLGRSLEHELGTCDNRYSGLCPEWFTGFSGTYDYGAGYHEDDTDRDGIPDELEIFGYEVATDPSRPQYLPRWGANPRHKDLFIEMDWRFSATHPVDFGFLQAVQNYYAVAPAAHIHNPDLTDGISLHVDIGKPPLAPTDTLHGDWGGSNRVANESLDHGPNFQIEIPPTSARRNLFRYALAGVNVSGGQAKYQHFGFGVMTPWTSYTQAVVDFAHELGHTLGLEHHGDPLGGWGYSNCNPLYRSVMSYTEGDLGFSVGEYDSVVMDPSSLSETSLSSTFDWDTIAGSGGPYYYTVWPGGPGGTLFDVDFNRDGMALNPPTTGAMRAPFPWPTRLGRRECGIHDKKLHPLYTNPPPPAPKVIRDFTTNSTPRFVQTPGSPNSVYVFRTSATGIKYARSDRHGVDNNGSCADSAGGSQLNVLDANTKCDDYGPDLGPTSGIPGTSSIAGFSVVYGLHGKVILTYWDTSYNLKVIEGTVNGGGTTDGTITWTTPVLLATNVRSEPEILGAGVLSGVQAIAYVHPDGTFVWHRRTLPSLTWGLAEPMLAETGVTIASTLVPYGAVVALPPTFSQAPMAAFTLVGLEPIQTCGIFPSGFYKEATFYCYEPNINRWRLHPNAFRDSTGSLQRIRSKAGLVLHYPRTSTGELWPIAGGNTRAEFWATLPLSSEAADEAPYIYKTGPFSYNNVSIPDALTFSTYGVSPLTNGGVTFGAASLFESRDSTGLRAVYAGYVTEGTISKPVITILPLVDGGWRERVSDGSDFRVMEHGICYRLNDVACSAVLNEWGY